MLVIGNEFSCKYSNMLINTNIVIINSIRTETEQIQSKTLTEVLREFEDRLTYC